MDWPLPQKYPPLALYLVLVSFAYLCVFAVKTSSLLVEMALPQAAFRVFLLMKSVMRAMPFSIASFEAA
jgi:hypothetical protein